MRLIESADVLLAGELDWDERELLEKTRSASKARLRAMVAELTPETTAQILAASERVGGPTGEIWKN